MIFYCGSKTPGMEKIEPESGAKLTESKMIAAFCIADPLEEPWHWFPCDFGSDGTVQYNELYPNAFKECTAGKSGFIYTVEAEEEEVVPSGEIVNVCHPKKPLEITGCIEIADLYDWLMEEEDMGRFRLCLFEQKTRQELLLWQNSILRYLAKYKMIDDQECAYAKFVMEKLPSAWEKYRKLCGK
ncbi:MAG: hypothetical protein IJ306_06055 [Oscillospiraceae bacterium]|nr:hypothetical protein [Oscillospiraceae bacterium]